MSEIFPRVAFPGDKISLAEYLDDPSAPEIKLGPGLRLVDAETDHPHALVVVAGVLQHREPARYWVDVSCLHVPQLQIRPFAFLSLLPSLRQVKARQSLESSRAQQAKDTKWTSEAQPQLGTHRSLYCCQSAHLEIVKAKRTCV